VKSRLLSVSALLCLAMMVTGARAGSAQEVQPLEPEWLLRMYAEGWQKVQEGVLRRDAGDGELETFSYGMEGLQRVVEGYELQMSRLEERYSSLPSAELAETIERLRGQIDALSQDAYSAPSVEGFDGAALTDCEGITFGAVTSAGPLDTAQGVKATASAYFHTTCAGSVGELFTLAFAEASEGSLHTARTQDDPKTGSWVDSYATESVQGSTGCFSYADASVSMSGSLIYQAPHKENYSCPLPFSVSITGPEVATTDYYTSSCADVTWTAATTGGIPSYTYEWYIGTSFEGSGSTLTKNYCATNAPVTVKVVARDGNGWTAERTFPTELRHIGALAVSANGPSQVNTTSSTTCADVTWTATATGAHPGYTYKWYLGVGTTVQGTASSFTKRYCSTTQNVTARVVVTDSDGHTGEATKQTSIIHTGPLVAAINGPSTVTTDYYTNACADVTWSASANGGFPGYTYQWYLGTSATLQGTGATFTKNYCSTNGTVTAKVVAKDTQNTLDDETFTTTLKYRAPIVASISGPATVSTDTATPCADVTWTASATSSGGNHSGFTYKWYVGTTLQGSGSTLTKRYCSTSQSVTVKVVATASDNHTSEATKTTAITHTSNPVPTISGPDEVWLSDYASCSTVTWTASVTGGAPAYTFSWYVGTTLVGSGTSYSKNYCRTNQVVNLKVVVRDSSGKTGEDLHATTIYYESACMAQDPDAPITNIPIDGCY
jgi:hypothetical protein